MCVFAFVTIQALPQKEPWPESRVEFTMEDLKDVMTPQSEMTITVTVTQGGPFIIADLFVKGCEHPGIYTSAL